MADVLERPLTDVPELPPTSVPEIPLTTSPADERRARRDLRDQIARLETELADLFTSAYPRTGFEWDVPSSGGPRMLSLTELEALRDDLADRVHDVRRRLGERTQAEEQSRCLIEEMMLEPERYKFVRVSAEDIGERGCKHWHVRPRFGILGMLMRWWRVRISSGCP